MIEIKETAISRMLTSLSQFANAKTELFPVYSAIMMGYAEAKFTIAK